MKVDTRIEFDYDEFVDGMGIMDPDEANEMVNEFFDEAENSPVVLRIVDEDGNSQLMGQRPLRTFEEIDEYNGEAFERVWLYRYDKYVKGDTTVDKDIMDEATSVAATVREKYPEELTPEKYQYWCGILAATNWVKGLEKDMLDT